MSENVTELPIRVFLTVENRLLRDALERLFRKRPDLLIVGSGEAGGSSRQMVLATRCDVLVLDFFDIEWLPSRLSAEGSDSGAPREVLIGMSDESEQFLTAIRGGVTGYLLKEASATEVMSAVRGAYRGEAACPPKLCAALFDYVSQKSVRAQSASPTNRPSLTLRQQRLIALVAKGLTNKEIASRLNISEFTVKNHIHRILRNVDAETRSQAVEAARSHGYSLSVAENA